MYTESKLDPAAKSVLEHLKSQCEEEVKCKGTFARDRDQSHKCICHEVSPPLACIEGPLGSNIGAENEVGVIN